MHLQNNYNSNNEVLANDSARWQKNKASNLSNNIQEKKPAFDNGFALEYESRLTFEKTIHALSGLLNSDGWKISHIHDLQQALKNNGQDVLPVHVIELCNPKYSGKLLEDDNTRFMSVMMPCRIAVYEKRNGTTFISLLNAENLIKMLGGSIRNEIRKVQDEVIDKINPLFTND